jgi:hypothetical protein
MVQLDRRTRKLLNIVNGKRHASDEDHEEPAAKRRQSSPTRKGQEEQDIFAEPASTDDELRAPPPRSSKPKKTVIKLAAPEGTEELKVPQRKSTRTQPDSRATPEKLAGTKQTKLVSKVQAEDKENTSTGAPRSSATSDQSDPFGFGLEHASQRSNKNSKAKTFGSKGGTGNIHTAQPAKKSSKGPAIRIPKTFKRIYKNANKDKAPLDSDGERSDVSMMSLEELEDNLGTAKQNDPELRKRDVKKRSKKKPVKSDSTTLADDELDELLQSTPDDEDLRRRSRRLKPTILHNQLGDWIKDRAPGSSQPESSTPEEGLDNLKEYLKQLPNEVEGSHCPICQEPVEQDYYWDYWRGKDKTVKNQNKFCRAHKTKSALDEYRSEGYPDIVWSTLPQRITTHRMELFKILNNDKSSGYRDRYEPIALTGKAAAVTLRRKDLPEHVQQELESYTLDDHSTYPGYYGPHGRRVITENVMKMLKNEIKKSSDAVVQGSGPATFVQAVLVPETAILLIMEDCHVDREEAEQIREKTYDLGMLLNEEIEDQVEIHDQSDEENEYGGR